MDLSEKDEYCSFKIDFKSNPLCVIRLDIRGGGKFENMWGTSFFFFACFEHSYSKLFAPLIDTRSFEVLMYRF